MHITQWSLPSVLSAIVRAVRYGFLFAVVCLLQLYFGTALQAVAAVPATLDPPVLSASGSTAIEVSWAPKSAPITHYAVRYRVYGQTWIVAASHIPGTVTTHTLTGLTPSTQYEVTVRPSNGDGNGAWSSASVLTLEGAPQVPAVPTALNATAGDRQVALNWSASSGATSYNVKRATSSGGPYTTVSSPTTNSHTDTSLTNGTTYSYVVSAVNAAGESGNSSQVSATPQGSVGDDIIWMDLIDIAPAGQLTKTSGDDIFAPTVASTSVSTYANGSVVDDGGNGRFLRHNIPANSLGAFIVTPRLSRETDWATLEYDIRFSADFDWQWGGKMGPGLIGVAPGHDIFEPTSCQPRTGQSFSTRLMWHGNNTNGTGSGRPFASKLPAIPAGSSDIVTYIYANHPYEGFGNCGWHTSLGALSKGTWHTIKQETRLNTVGQNNGVFRVWIDGVLKFEATNWSFRTTNSVRIQAILWDIHRGGGLPQWGSPLNGHIDIRNVVVRDLTP